MKAILFFILLFGPLIGLHALESVTQVSPTRLITLAGIPEYPKNYVTYHSKVYTEALKRLGYQFSYKELPFFRSTKLSISGDIDGEISRYDGYENQNPELIKINFPLMKIPLNVYTLDSKLKINSYNDLDHKKFIVNYLQGTVVVQKQLEKNLSQSKIFPINSLDQGIEKLKAKRANVLIVPNFFMQNTFKNINRDKPTLYLAGSVESLNVYGYLNKRHEKLAKSLEAVLREMKNEGFLDKLYHECQLDY